MTDDDIRAMLRAKAAEATVSADAWERITARLGAPARRPIARRLAVAGAAAAAVAGTVLVANLPTSNVATPPVTTVEADAEAIDAAVRDWLAAHLPAEVEPGASETSRTGDTARVVFREGDLATELFLQQLSGRPGWAVTGAASDLIPIFDPVFEGSAFRARATAEAAGTVEVFYRSDAGNEAADEPSQVEPRQTVPLARDFPGARAVTVLVVLRTNDGTTAISEVTATDTSADPGARVGSHVALWPAVDSVGLAALQEQADAGERPDLLDPVAVASGFLSELLPRSETPTSFGIDQEFRRGDNTSGEVGYTLSDGSSGTILVRTIGDEGSIWYVTGATSDTLELVTTRREETHLVADVRSSADGTLRWTGATDVDVQAGQTVSIGRPDTPLGRYPVVVRLMDGNRTLALVAALA